MVTIVSSSYALGHPQTDGRRYVIETHVDDAGETHTREYGPVGDIDYAAALAEHAATLDLVLNPSPEPAQ